MKILITGGGGFIGSHLCEAELESGNEVVAFDVAPPDKIAHLLENSNFKYCRSNLDAENLENWIRWSDLVYHLGAIASVYVYCTNPRKVLDVNVKGTIRVAELCFRYGKKLVFSSSSEVYGKSARLPWREDGQTVMDTPEKTRWCYASSKIIGEHYLFALAKDGLKMAICRFFNFYGPRLDQLDEKGRVITCFLNNFLKDEPVRVYEPGDQTRCFTYVDDGVSGIMAVAHKPEAEGGAFNIGDDREITMLELAKLMKKLGGFNSQIVVVPGSHLYGGGYEDVFRRVPDKTKTRTVLGWEPKVSLEEGLKKTIEYFKNKNGA